MQQQTCHFCGNKVDYIHVHGHYQCPVCNTNALPCCDGDNCETNIILREKGILPDNSDLNPIVLQKPPLRGGLEGLQ